MALAEWLAGFRELHARAKAGKLSGDEQGVYLAGRDELARALLAAQRAATRPGETPRQALRVARALQVDLDWVISAQRGVTIDISAGGFSTLLAKAPPANEELSITLRLPGGEPLATKGQLVDARPLTGNVRASFAFTRLSGEERERIELVVFDTILSQLRG